MRLVHASLALVMSASVAAAQPAIDTQAEDTSATATGTGTAPAEEQDVVIGFAVNSPLGWRDANSVGFSAYIGFADRHALRLNVAHYKYDAFGPAVVGLAGIEDEASRAGGTTDLSASYQYYPRGLFDGFFVEGGVMSREIEKRYEDEHAMPAILEKTSDGVAGRALVGWSWLWSKRVFAAAAVGAAMGRYEGTERSAMTTFEPEYRTESFVRYEPSFEAYLRIGLAMGL